MLRFPLLILTATLLLFVSSPVAYGQAGEQEMATLAKQLAGPLVEKQRPKVTALSFTDLRGRPNELGLFLAEQFAVEMVAIKGITVLDRTNIASVMAEHKLTAEGLVRPENAKKLGQFAGVDAIVIGTLTSIDNQIVLTVKAISTETAEVVAAGRATIPATPDLLRKLGMGVAAAIVNTSGTTNATASEGEAIATRDIGPLTATLRNVVEHTLQMGSRNRGDERTVPAIRCTFDFENRNLQRSVAVAANQCIESNHELRVADYRGEVVDEGSNHWGLKETRGIPAVAGFQGKCCVFTVVQGVPGSIIDCIRSGRKYTGIPQDMDSGTSQLFWFGSLGTIPPGETIRVTVDFAREVGTNGNKNDRGERNLVRLPANFQLDMELVLATFAEGEDPVNAKDLTLRNLTIDRVVLPAKAKPEK